MRQINLLQPTFDEQTKKELLDVLDSGWVMMGPKTIEFEKEFAKYVGAKYAIATNSATSALDLCLKIHDIKGGELITPSFTFTSDAHVGEWNDMDVTFCDIDPETFCVDVNSLNITDKTKAIIAVDCHGRLADIGGIRAKCEEAGVKPLIIEDAAHAMYTPGVGTGDITVYSFQAVKTLPIYDGGMITTNDKEVYKRLRPMTWLGIEKLTYERVIGGKYTWDYDIKDGGGIKAYMTDVQAVIGLGQLRRLEEMNERRRVIQTRYNNAFEGNPWFKRPLFSHTVQYYTPNWINRDGLATYLSKYGIHTSVHFKPLHQMTYWRKGKKCALPNTDMIWKTLLSLPVHNALTDEEQEFVIEIVKEFYEIPD